MDGKQKQRKMANTKETSKEEIWMFEYFLELQKKKIIKELISQPKPLVLSPAVPVTVIEKLKTKEKFISKNLIQEHIYTADFKIYWENAESPFHRSIHKLDKKFPPFIAQVQHGEWVSYVEVKATYDANNMTRIFTSRTQPWIFDKYGVYINLVKIPDIFKHTFIPEKILPNFYYQVNTKKCKKGDKKFTWEYRTLNDFL